MDNIYQVSAVSIGQTAVPGVGFTYVAKVTASLSSYNGLTGIGFSGFMGNIVGEEFLGYLEKIHNHLLLITMEFLELAPLQLYKDIIH